MRRLAEAVVKQYGRMGVALLVGLQPLNPKEAQGAAARVFVRLVDLHREGKVLSQFAVDWSENFGFGQKQIDRKSRLLVSRVIRDYVASPPPAVASEVVSVQMVGLEQDDGFADALAAIFERQVQGIDGRIEVEPPRPTAEGETVTTFRFSYIGAGGTRQLREDLRRVLRSPVGIPSRFFAGNGSTLVVRVGKALEVPPWVALTDPKRPSDDEFVQQLKSTLQTLGSPRVAVVVLEDAVVGKWQLSTLQPVVQTELRAAGCDVVSPAGLEQFRKALLQQHQQFHVEDGIAQAMAFADAADFVLLLRPIGADSAVAELMDLDNGRLFGAIPLPAKEMTRNKALPLNADDPAHVGRYVAGATLTFLIRQGGVPNVTEVVIKNARSASDLDAIADLLVTGVPNVVGVHQRSFAYGVGRFMLAYNGPFDAIAARINRGTQALPLRVQVDRSSPGLVELYVNERAVFVPRPPPPVQPGPVKPDDPPENAPPPAPLGWMAPAQEAPAVAAPLAGNNLAVIVAVDKFEKQAPLHASKDASKLFLTLKQFCGFKEKNVRLLANGFGENVEAPTRENILRAIDAVAQVAGPDDSILIMFSTHGTVDLKNNETLLVPSDESKGLVSVAEIREKLSKSHARASVLILDACQSAGRFDKVPASTGALAVGAHRDGVGLITLAGCRIDQSSIECSKVNGGLFTHFLCQGLQGSADRWAKGNKNKEVSLDELYLYTHDQVSQFAATLKDKDGNPLQQNPTKLGIETGEIVLVRFKPR